LARLSITRAAVGRRAKMCVTFPAPSTGRNHRPLAGLFQIGQKLARRMVPNDRAERDFDHTIFAAPPMAVAARAIAAASALDQFLITQIEKCRQLWIGCR